MPLRLKSLELHGYKTFASRTLFEFAGTITAIVGPNGSGKSNIADSLRWVLGEQSYSLLRGRKTEDMIFSGSEFRARAGMASATITFDNWDGWLPIDFSEVAITRRAYRDGQNEYLINGQRVRLKDVSELLAQSGLAERTYTIIGQGLVDAALALKAEERRRLFEEAAGIGLHRSRREEALRRLETTRRNLDRVQDILAELQPRLRSLERQARRAQEYEQVKADLQVALREWYGYQWHRAQRELSEAREASRNQEAALDRARQEQAAQDEKLTAERSRVQNLRASLNTWHRQSAQLHTRRESLSRELAVASERLLSFHQQQQNAQSEIARLEEDLDLQKTRLEQSAQEVSRLQEELEEARIQVTAARQSLTARLAERVVVEKDLQAARQKLGALNSRQAQLQARISERRTQAGRLQAELDAAGKAVQAAEQELIASQNRVRTAERAQKQAELACKEAEQAFQAQHQSLLDAEVTLKQVQETRSNLGIELARSKAQFGVLEQAENALAGYAGGTRLLLQASRQARLEGMLGALNNYLEVPGELEIAIAAVLGEYLDAVVLESDAGPALDLLTGHSTRGVLLPLKMLKPLFASQPLTQEENSDGYQDSGLIGVAAELVKAPPELRPAVDLLLGEVLVVQDRPAARRVLDHFQSENGNGRNPVAPANLRVVTLLGEVFYANGAVLSGGGSGESGQSVLSRQRQRRELGQQIAEAENRLADLDEQLLKLDREHKTLQAESDRLAQVQRTARQQEEQLSRALNQARLVVERAAQQSRWQQEQRDRLRLEHSQGEAEAKRLAAELEQVEAEISKARERLRECNTALSALSLDELQAQVAHWNTQAAVSERLLSEGKARQRELQAILNRSASAKSALHARIHELDQAQAELEGARVAQLQAEAEIGLEIDAVRATIEPAEAELDILEKEQISLQAAEAASRQSLSITEHHHAQTRINLARRQESMDALRRRIEDDFGLVAFDYEEDMTGPTPLPLEGMVEQLPRVSHISPEIEETVKRQRAQLRRMGPVNPEAQAEYQEVKERHSFLTSQVEDLEKAEIGVRQVIEELDVLMEREFLKTFESVAEEFKQIFSRLFEGGSARLMLTDPGNLTESGIDIEARLPGRRTQGLSLLSGGERSLTATALVFALLKVSPTPFCVLDEVDAMLDEANVGRFRDLLRELSQNTQFVVVTHNRNTVQVADVIYGVTMGRDSASQILSLKLDEVSQVVE